ncbi:PREDICTED: interleukin-1 receptor type 1-like [Gekko japonicus]|uniref:Interleukin-1 receptor type 1-like n=1 Tax=Gekko japonicus TaxID=146911 RepID=A0ABM1JYA9_GEKJA|nr:PREDICTED: interleukin-1 receptor type 1-like [Gekko japonicus]
MGQQKMISVLWLACWISVAYSLHNRSRIVILVPVGEAVAISCPLLSSQQSNRNVTWYRNGSVIPLIADNYLRIHQRRNLLWLIPAKIEDSGFYECHIGNSETDGRELQVFENDDGLYFNKNAAYVQKLPLENNGNLVCPDLEYFESENSSLILQWSKAYSPGLFEDQRFRALEYILSINNVNESDKGIYVCQTTYTYMGKWYNVSRAINLITYASPLKLPQIIYPKNNSIEVELGSKVLIECNASGDTQEIFTAWEVNGTELEEFDDTLRVETYSHVSLSGKWIVGTKFNISVVKNKDYLTFLCFVWTPTFEGAAVYIMLQRPTKNIQGYLIGGLVSPILVILAAVLTYKIFKVDIVLWYRQSCQPLFRKEVSDGKLYDAYVVYPSNVANCMYSSDIFVLKVLPEVLEKQCGYNLFICGRDDLPGQAVITVVDEAIRLSRRVIIVLVPDSYSNKVQRDTNEQQIAIYNALIRDDIKVILILLDKIKDYANMPEPIKYLKQRHGVLIWKGDFSEQSQLATTKFWKNVRYRMPVRHSPPSLDHQLMPVTLTATWISEG